jgi:hypothetical protein
MKKSLETIKKEREHLDRINAVEELLKIGSQQVNIFHSPVNSNNKNVI